MSVMLHVANLHKVEVVTASISAQILLVVPTYKVLNAHFVNAGSRNLYLSWSDQVTANPR